MTDRVETGPGWELREGRWEDVLADVESVDAVITDPPYSERTHKGQRHGRKDPRYSPDKCLTGNGIPYGHWTTGNASDFVCTWSDAAVGWLVILTSHDLAPQIVSAAKASGRYVFAPLACVISGMNVRLAGDGPSNWTVWCVVSRTAALHRWGTLPGAYTGAQDQQRKVEGSIPGAKPLWLMRALVRDYSRPGDLICDPCAGSGTTLLAAVTEGRRAIGAEMDPDTFDLAVKRLRKGYTPAMDFGKEER